MMKAMASQDLQRQTHCLIRAPGQRQPFGLQHWANQNSVQAHDRLMAM
jgi:hypothetical protein